MLVCTELRKTNDLIFYLIYIGAYVVSMSPCQNLSNNQLHLEGAQIISKMLSITCNITTLKLSGDWQSLFPGEHICVCTSAISEFLFLTCTFLHAGNHFDDSAAKYLADALKVISKNDQITFES